MYIIFLALLVIMFATISVLSALRAKKHKDTVYTEKIRCEKYIKATAHLWGLVIFVSVMCFIGGISLPDIGFRPISFNNNIWFTVVTLIVSGAALVYFVYELIASLVSKKSEENIDGSHGEMMAAMLPRTKKEKWLFSFRTLSAAICEETVFRGFLLFLLKSVFPDTPIYLIILIACVIFGVSHLYQGLQGVISTGLMAVLFICLFLVTDSLILVMLLHFATDFSATFVLSEFGPIAK